MLRHTVLVLLALGPLTCTVAAAGPEPSFHFVLTDEDQQLRGRSGRVAQQVVDIFREMQIRATWSSDPNDPGLDPARSVIVGVLSHSSRDRGMAPGALGAALTKADSRSVFIFYPDIERALDLRPVRDPSILSGGWPIVRWQRAIARVIAHEILHYFLPGRPHDATGLFSEDLTGSRLTRPSLDVTEKTRIAFTAVLARFDRDLTH
jgi:hypothetical protein